MCDFCSCWHIVHGKEICYGTKELDECSCGGLKSKCDFYEEVRRSAENKSSVKQYKTTKEKLINTERELYCLKLQLAEKIDECATLRAMLRSLSSK